MPRANEIIRATRKRYVERLAAEFARLRTEHPDGIFTAAALRGADGQAETRGAGPENSVTAEGPPESSTSSWRQKS